MLERRSRALWWAAGALILAVACGEAQEAAAPAPAREAPVERATAKAPAAASEAARAEAEQIFATRCTTCHGPRGAGDGPGSPGLTPAPRDFQDPEWQASVTDEHLAKIIKFGGAAVGKSPAMPGNPDLMAKAEVVDALCEHIRNLARR